MSLRPRSSFSSKVLGLKTIYRRSSGLGRKGFEKNECESGSVRIIVNGLLPSLISCKSCKSAEILPLNSASLSTNGLLS